MPTDDSAEQIAAALGVLLLRVNRAHLYDQVTIGVAGVDATTYPVLSGLARSGPVTATRLAELIGLDRTVTTRYATRLEEAGLLVRTPHGSDGRATQLALTAAGRRAVKSLRAALRAAIAQALADWTPAEAQACAVSLQRLTAALTASRPD